MRMRVWGVLGVFCFGLLVLGSQGFAASQTLRFKQAEQRRLGRQVAAAELSRLHSAGVARLRADSVIRPRVVEGQPMQVVVVTGAASAGAVPVTVRVLGAGGEEWYEHQTQIVAPMRAPGAIAREAEVQP